MHHYNTWVPRQHYEDPVAAYDRLAPAYAGFSKRREAYLRGVEREIVARISQVHSLLDIGAGDGLRATRIAGSLGISKMVLVEPSSAMARLLKNTAEIWQIRGESLDASAISERFDLITCLWNVLGHVPGQKNRALVLSTAAKLLSMRGWLFVDINHRYNAGAYGWPTTCGRWLRDTVIRDAQAGDVTATWNVGHASISTYGHVFTHREIEELAEDAGLKIEERIVIDYGNGSPRRLPWQGNLLYILRRNSRMDSSSAPAIS